MMGGFARIVGIAMVGVIGACHGADQGDPNDSMELPARRREEPASAPLPDPGSSSSGGSSSGTPSDPDAGAPADASADAPTLIGAGIDFLDDFNRADGVDVGNGWIEKVDSFSILKNQTRQSAVGSYRDLIVRVGDHTIRQQRPVAFQAGAPVSAHFVRHGDTFSIAVGRYDRTRPLLIDPPRRVRRLRRWIGL